MPNQHKAPMLGWHPPAELSAWARAEAERRDVPLKVILDEALSEYRARTDLACFRVAGFDDEGLDFTQPVEVRCERCGEARTFTDRDDGGADHTESLSVLLKWAQDHQCKEAGS